MSLKKLDPITQSMRGTVLVDKSEIDNVRPEKSLIFGLRKNGGRNNLGRITVRGQGGGAKRMYRMVDFSRSKLDIAAEVKTIEYDPNRNAFIALIKYTDGQLSYIIAPQGLKKGDKVISSSKVVDIKPGNTMYLKNIPIGTTVHNIELRPNTRAQLVRSAGTSAQIINREGNYVTIRLSSGEVRMILSDCKATVGVVSNFDHKNISLGKAGRNRWLGVKPTVRGVAMNPVDHPHGGGEGKSSGGRHPVTPWGLKTKGKKTRSMKKNSRFIVTSRHFKRK